MNCRRFATTTSTYDPRSLDFVRTSVLREPSESLRFRPPRHMPGSLDNRKKTMELQTLIQKAVELKASDLHLMAGDVPRVRVSGSLVKLDVPEITNEELRELLRSS